MKYFLIILIVLILYLLYKIGSMTYERYIDDVPTVSRPYINFYDQSGNKFNIVAVSKPFSHDGHAETMDKHENKLIFVGICSYLEFPNEVSSTYEKFQDNYDKYKYKERCKAWLHGFRDPEKYFPEQVPRVLISESDFCDCNINKPDPNVGKKYDFLYICLKQDESKKTCDDWATYNKNWTLAKKCLKVMCDKLHMKGLLIGRKDCELPGICHKYMDTTNMISNDELRKCYDQSRFIFLPNYADASPRVLTEAMCHNLPALVNENILGGWKYINEETGQFFTSEDDIETSIKLLMDNIVNNKYTPRRHFITNYGVVNSGKRLKDFFYDTFGNQINIPRDKCEYMVPGNPKTNYLECEL